MSRFRTIYRMAGIATLALMVMLGFVTGCTPTGTADNAPLPTVIDDLDAAATAQIMTLNAPPQRFRERITLSGIETGLDALSGWRYNVTAEFEGIFTGTSRPAVGVTTAEVAFHQLTSARRVVLAAEGSLLAEEGRLSTEAVRIGRDVYLIADNQCTIVTDTDAATVADTGAELLIGGISEAVPVGITGVINGENVFRYEFTQDALQLASIAPRDGGSVSLVSSELWFSGERGVAVRLYMTLDVVNAAVFGSQLPVDGRVILRYDLMDVGDNLNISVPFGC